MALGNPSPPEFWFGQRLANSVCLVEKDFVSVDKLDFANQKKCLYCSTSKMLA